MLIRFTLKGDCPIKKNEYAESYTVKTKEPYMKVMSTNQLLYYKPLKFPIKYYSARYNEYTKAVINQLFEMRSLLEKQAGQKLPLDKPLIMACIFYKAKDSNVDVTNLLETPQDILAGSYGITMNKDLEFKAYKVIADDNKNIIVSPALSRVFVDKFNPRTEIFIADYDEADFKAAFDILFKASFKSEESLSSLFD